MADTKHRGAASAPVEGDGIRYSGITWFVVILTVTTLVCQALMWALFVVLEKREASMAATRPPLSAPVGQAPPSPNLLYIDTTTNIQEPVLGEPTNLERFRQMEDASLTSYGWMDRATETFHIPIEAAKTLLLERGLPTREAK
jgi:hypothetical protein